MASQTNISQRKGLRIQLLGGFRVIVGDTPIQPERWRLRKARSLVKLIALAPDHHLHREQLMDTLWRGYSAESAANNLHQALHAARRALAVDETTPQELLYFENEIIGLRPERGIWIDVPAFEAAAEQARISRDPVDYLTALELYSGDLLPEDLYEDWAFGQREALRQTYLSLIFELARVYEIRGEFSPAAATLQKALAVEPARQETHTELMRLYALGGQRQQALRQFTILRDILRRELDAEPDPQAERLYQKILAGKFPPVEHERRVLSTPVEASQPGLDALPKHNLPRLLTRFIGRREPLQQVKALLVDSRLVTLTGSGGVGKTSLAIQVACETLDDYPNGAWLVDLTPLTDATLLDQSISQVFGLRAEGNQPILTVLQNYLQHKACLLVLDNCEHLIEACAQITAALLQYSPGLRILASSREPLGVAGEAAYRVPPMDFPDPQHLPDLETMMDLDSVHLFSERARTAYPLFRVSADNARSVARICQRLDGIPLALEMAAARVNVMSTEEIANHLDDCFRLLTGGSRNALPRHRTLQASMDWSYNLLDEAEQTFLRRLAVFSGGWNLAAAEAICADPLESRLALDLTAQLVNKSLVVAERSPGKATRYRLLETVRQYALDKLGEAGEVFVLRDRHLAYYLELAKQGQPRKGVKAIERWEYLEDLRIEQDNLFSSLEWALGEPASARARQGLELACALGQYWDMSGLSRSGCAWLERGLALLGREDPTQDALRARALALIGYFLIGEVRIKEAEQWLKESVALYQNTNDRCGLASAYWYQAYNYSLFDATCMTAALNQALPLARETGNIGLITWILVASIFLGGVDKQAWIKEAQILYQKHGEFDGFQNPREIISLFYAVSGDYLKASLIMQEIYEDCIKHNVLEYACQAVNDMGNYSYRADDYRSMESHYLKALTIARELGRNLLVIYCLRQLGIAVKRLGDLKKAASYYSESLSHSQAINDLYGIYACVAGLGGTAAQAGYAVQAARLMGATQALFESFTKPMDFRDQLEFKRDVQTARQALEQAEFDAAWSDGRALTLEEAIKEGLEAARVIAEG